MIISTSQPIISRSTFTITYKINLRQDLSTFNFQISIFTKYRNTQLYSCVHRPYQTIRYRYKKRHCIEADLRVNTTMLKLVETSERCFRSILYRFEYTTTFVLFVQWVNVEKSAWCFRRSATSLLAIFGVFFYWISTNLLISIWLIQTDSGYHFGICVCIFVL